MGLHKVGNAYYVYDCYPINYSFMCSDDHYYRLSVYLARRQTVQPFCLHLHIRNQKSGNYEIQFINGRWVVSTGEYSVQSPAKDHERYYPVDREKLVTLESFPLDKFDEACRFCITQTDPNPGEINWTETEKEVTGEVFINYLSYKISKPVTDAHPAYRPKVIGDTARSDKLNLSTVRAECNSLAAAKEELARHYKQFRESYYANEEFPRHDDSKRSGGYLEKPSLDAPLDAAAHWIKVDTPAGISYYLAGGEENKIHYCIFKDSGGYKGYKIVFWQRHYFAFQNAGWIVPRAHFIGENKSLRKVKEQCAADYNSEYQTISSEMVKLPKLIEGWWGNLTSFIKNYNSKPADKS